MALELRHLRLIRTVAEERSLTRAAKRLYLTQSALSHQLRVVETHFQTALFRRENRQMLLTPAGERLLQAAHVVEAALDEAEQEIRYHAAGEAGVVRLSTECYTSYHWLPDVLGRFAREYPRVEVKLEVEATANPTRALLDGTLDLAIVTRTISDRRLCIEPLFQDEFVALSSADHRWAARSFVEAEDFREEHLITYALPSEELTVFQQLLFPAGVMPRKVTRMQLTEGIVEFVRAGLGVTVLPRWIVQPHLARGLAATPLTAEGLFREWSAATSTRVAAPPHLTALIRLIAADAGPAATSRPVPTGS